MIDEYGHFSRLLDRLVRLVQTDEREREKELSVCRYHVSERIADVFAISFKLIGSTALNVVKINERLL